MLRDREALAVDRARDARLDAPILWRGEFISSDLPMVVAQEAPGLVVRAPGDFTIDLACAPCSLSEVLDAVGSAVGRQWSESAGVVRWVEPGEGFVARAVPPRWVNPASVVEAYGRMSQSGVSAAVVGSRVVLTGGEASVLEAIEASSTLLGADPWVWSVTMHVIETRTSSAADRMLKASSSGTVGLRMEIDGSITGRVVGAGGADAEWRLDGESGEFRSLAVGTVSVVEGESARWSIGERLPIPRRTVSPEGTVTVSGYEHVDVGYLCQVHVWASPEGAGVRLTPEVSSVTGFVVEAPIVARRAMEWSGYVRDGDVVPVGRFQISDESSRRPLFGIGSTRSSADRHIWFVAEFAAAPAGSSAGERATAPPAEPAAVPLPPTM